MEAKTSPGMERMRRARRRQAWVAAAGALPLLTGILLWAWLLAGVLSPLGAVVRTMDDPRSASTPSAARPAGPEALACAPCDSPAAVVAGARHR
jgi:hypothetical protein